MNKTEHNFHSGNHADVQCPSPFLIFSFLIFLGQHRGDACPKATTAALALCKWKHFLFFKGQCQVTCGPKAASLGIAPTKPFFFFFFSIMRSGNVGVKVLFCADQGTTIFNEFDYPLARVASQA